MVFCNENHVVYQFSVNIVISKLKNKKSADISPIYVCVFMVRFIVNDIFIFAV